MKSNRFQSSFIEVKKIVLFEIYRIMSTMKYSKTISQLFH